jgi:HEAT repeat protein
MDALDSSRLAQHQDLEAFPPQVVRTLQSSGAAHGAALAAALEYDDKRVRYAAAEALVRLAPTRPFANSDKVAENLAGALRESSSRVIIVAARDQQVRNRLSAIVRDLNHLPFAVPTAKQGLLRARSAPTQDAIIVHTRFRDDDFNTSRFLEEIERDYRTKGIPIIVVAPPDQVDKKRRQFTQAAAVLPDDVDPIVLKDQLEALWSGDNGRPNDPKRKAIALARQAALAVAESDPRSSVFALEATAPALLEAVERQPDEVRIPALRALGILGSTQAIAKVAVAFDNQLNHREVRIAAAFCLGEALRGKALPSKIFESFVQAMQSEDLGLFRSCGEALGKMRLSRDQALELFPTLRVE